MFDGLLGRGFAPKGKPLIKLTKNRIDVLRRKRTATIKFLRKDLADLVSNGLDVNAYSRAGGLLDELRLLWNLDFVEKTCDFVYKQLSTMQKMEECPEDCREAVSSLMFAASGFSELPELRELRQMFHEKYADSLGLFVNQELAESMSSKPFSLEKKVKLMEDVALEFSIRWDSKAFERRIMRHNSSSVKETPKSTYDKPVHGRDPLFQPDKQSYQNGLRGNQHGLASKERSGNVSHASRLERHEPIFNEGDTIVMKIKRENLVHGNGHRNSEADAPKKTEVTEKPRHSSTKKPDKLVLGFKQESFFQGYKHENHEEHAPQKVEENISRPPKPSSKSKRTDSIDSGRRHRNDQESRENAVLVGESTAKDHANPAGKVEERETERMKSPLYKSLPPPPYVKPSGKAKNENAEASVYPEIDKNVAGVERGNVPSHHQVNGIDDQSLKRRSSRRKHIIQSSGDDDTRSRRRENSRKGLQVLIDEDEKDSEEKMMDKLLLHYSKKPSSYDNVQQESKSRRSQLKNAEGEDMLIPKTARSRSLPNDQFSGPSEPAITIARASSFQPERSSDANKHVHPKLPNYDDLAARFAELKGR
uniref:IST1-like protein n=1 Tax=Noccaea caerulescens TaxID=107243 RepID=A0A1J3CZK5_NOCCA